MPKSATRNNWRASSQRTPPDFPRITYSEVAPLRRKFARALLTALGWRIEGEKPLHRKYVLIAAPHTSNWDFPLMILFGWAFDIRMSWMGKQSLFHAPYGWIMRALGGVPVKRGEKGNLVDAMVKTFDERDSLVVVVPTEGTRVRTDYWKSGFYHIARGAGVPIVPSYLDFGQKRGGFGPALPVSGNLAHDMDLLRGFYAPMKGRYPDQFGPVRLREEEATGDLTSREATG
jgi:1-acyl-sn-glycerol-3-phosphate acyltransferase